MCKVEDRFTAFGSGLIKLGVKPGQETFVGIYAKNCIEVWQVLLIVFLEGKKFGGKPLGGKEGNGFGGNWFGGKVGTFWHIKNVFEGFL